MIKKGDWPHALSHCEAEIIFCDYVYFVNDQCEVFVAKFLIVEGFFWCNSYTSYVQFWINYIIQILEHLTS